MFLQNVGLAEVELSHPQEHSLIIHKQWSPGFSGRKGCKCKRFHSLFGRNRTASAPSWLSYKEKMLLLWIWHTVVPSIQEAQCTLLRLESQSLSAELNF